MEFLVPGWLLAAPAFAGALVILYFLKLKRREVVVSSTFLWQQAVQDLRVNSPFQRLRKNLLLLLQLLALLLILLALARPVGDLGEGRQADTILLLDVSASMQATDGDADGATRFERMRQEALRLVDQLGYEDRAALIAFADESWSLTPLTNSRSALRAALEGLEPTDRPTAFAPAIQRLRSLLPNDGPAPQVYVFSDGRVGPLAGIQLDAKVPLRFVQLGEPSANAGIVGVDVRLGGIGEGSRMFVSVFNGGAETLSGGVDVFLQLPDGSEELLDSRQVDVSGGEIAPVLFESDLGEGRVRVALTPEDALPADNTAYALLRPQEALRVLLVSDGNLFLQRAFEADPLVLKDGRGVLPRIDPAAFDPDSPELLAYDMIVLDRFRPERLGPGNYLCFGEAPPFPGLEDLGLVNDARILDWDETHDVARFVNFATLRLPTARRFALRPKDEVIVRSDKGPLISVAKDEGRLAVVCSFDLLTLPVEGAWTFDPSFPIFLANATRWLGGAGQTRRSLLLPSGGVAELRFPPRTVRAEVTPPAGEVRELEVHAGDDALRVSGLGQAGFYGVELFDDQGELLRSTEFAVNLSSQSESEIAPIEELALEERDAVQADASAEPPRRDLWKWATLAALALVMLEWWVYNRRTYL
ncbi:MAG: BatA and WFA domain-containing protein [Planctomycetes bacterium]|nr:BatA and WFA domain-containing protein [Planctomycetota bacterium]